MKLRYFATRFASVMAAATLTMTACDDDILYDFDGIRLGTESQGAVVSGNSSLVEIPELQKGDLFITHNLIGSTDTVMNYSLAYDTVKMHSRWVAFRFDGSNRKKNTGRSDSDAFQDDPDLPSRFYVGSYGFGSGYDRGHLCASNDRLISEEANRQTFYMTNMSPQMSAFNQLYWVGFELYVQDLGRSESFSDTLYVVKGGTIKDSQIEGYITRPNGKTVPVPKYYYMALLSCKSGSYSAIGFWMEHRSYDEVSDVDKTEIAKRAVCIDELEELTGINFFHNLPDAVEAKVEAEYQLSSWNLQ